MPHCGCHIPCHVSTQDICDVSYSSPQWCVHVVRPLSPNGCTALQYWVIHDSIIAWSVQRYVVYTSSIIISVVETVLYKPSYAVTFFIRKHNVILTQTFMFCMHFKHIVMQVSLDYQTAELLILSEIHFTVTLSMRMSPKPGNRQSTSFMMIVCE